MLLPLFCLRTEFLYLSLSALAYFNFRKCLYIWWLTCYFVYFFIVEGASLKKVLDGGIRGGMDKAMMLLLQRAARKPADVAKAGPSGVPHSVSIELLDDQGNKVIKDN